MKKFYVFQLILLSGMFVFILYLMAQLERRGIGQNLSILLGLTPELQVEATARNGSSLDRTARILTRPQIEKKLNSDKRSHIDKNPTNP